MDELEKLRKEIERLKGWNNNVRNSKRHMTLQEEDFNRGKHSSYLEILSLIDSMKKEHASEDLEKAAYQYACKCHPLETEYGTSIPNPEVENAVKFGAKWQRQKDEHLIWQISSANYEKGIEEGKQQMMEDAVEAEIEITSNGILLPNLKAEDFGYADKVRIIIIKED